MNSETAAVMARTACMEKITWYTLHFQSSVLYYPSMVSRCSDRGDSDPVLVSGVYRKKEEEQ